MIDQVIHPGRRVTVAMGTNRNLDAGQLTSFILMKACKMNDFHRPIF